MKIIRKLDLQGMYEIECECGKVDRKLMHGIVWCANCTRNRPAHDMLMEYQKRQEFLDSVTGFTSPASVTANENATVKTPGAGD